MRAEVEAAARRGGGGPITFALGAHLSMAKQEFGWENYDLSPRDQVCGGPVFLCLFFFFFFFLVDGAQVVAME